MICSKIMVYIKKLNNGSGVIMTFLYSLKGIYSSLLIVYVTYLNVKICNNLHSEFYLERGYHKNIRDSLIFVNIIEDIFIV
jgi:hypothetical protein